jgi:hypothetical protein
MSTVASLLSQSAAAGGLRGKVMSQQGLPPFCGAWLDFSSKKLDVTHATANLRRQDQERTGRGA